MTMQLPLINHGNSVSHLDQRLRPASVHSMGAGRVLIIYLKEKVWKFLHKMAKRGQRDSKVLDRKDQIRLINQQHM